MKIGFYFVLNADKIEWFIKATTTTTLCFIYKAKTMH